MGLVHAMRSNGPLPQVFYCCWDPSNQHHKMQDHQPAHQQVPGTQRNHEPHAQSCQSRTYQVVTVGALHEWPWCVGSSYLPTPMHLHWLKGETDDEVARHGLQHQAWDHHVAQGPGKTVSTWIQNHLSHHTTDVQYEHYEHSLIQSIRYVADSW